MSTSTNKENSDSTNVTDISDISSTMKKENAKKQETCGICSKPNAVLVCCCIECAHKLCFICGYKHIAFKVHTVMWSDVAEVAEKMYGFKSVPVLESDLKSTDDENSNNGLTPMAQNICETGRKSKNLLRKDYQRMLDHVFKMKDIAKQLSIKYEDQCLERIDSLSIYMLSVAKLMDDGGEEVTDGIGKLASAIARESLHGITDELFVYEDNPRSALGNSNQAESQGLNEEQTEKKRQKRRELLRTLTLEKSPGNYLRLSSYFFTNIQTVKLQHTARRLKVMDGYLWLSTWKSVRVCRLDLSTVREIRYKSSDEVCGIVPAADNSVIAAYYDKGLSLVDSEGARLNLISQGNFADIMRFEGRLYALEYYKSYIQVFEEMGTTYMKGRQIPLSYDNISCSDTIYIMSEKIYICSSLNHCLYIYTHKGKQEAQYGHYGHHEDTSNLGALHYPRLCAVDANGYAIVADCWNKRIQVCSKTGEWKLLNILGDNGELWDVAMGDTIHSLCAITDNDGYKMLQLSTDFMI